MQALCPFSPICLMAVFSWGPMQVRWICELLFKGNGLEVQRQMSSLPTVGWTLVCSTHLRRCGLLMGFTHRLVVYHAVLEWQLSSYSAVLTQTHELKLCCNLLWISRSRSCRESWSSPTWPHCWWRTWCPDRSQWVEVSPGSRHHWPDRGWDAPYEPSLLPAPAGSWRCPTFRMKG